MEFKKIISDSSIALIIKGLSAAFGFLFSVIIARFYFAEGAGLYYLSFSFLLILTIICKYGFTTYILKEFSSNFKYEHKERVNNIVTIVILISVIASILTFSFSKPISIFFYSNYELEIFISLTALAIVPYTLTFIFSSLNQSRGNLKIAMCTQNLVCYALSCITVFFFGAYSSNYLPVVAFSFSAYISLALSYFYYQKSQKHRVLLVKLGKNISSEDNKKYFLSEVLIAFNNWAPLIFVSAILDSKATGIYAICSRISWLLSFLLVSVNAVVAPVLARHFKNRSLDQAKKIYLNFTLLLALLSLPAFILCILWPEKILAIFGDNFVTGSNALRILILAQFVNVLTGPIGMVLLMGNKANIVNICTALSLLIGCLLIILLTNKYSLVGASIGAAAGMSLANLGMAYLAFFRINVFRSK
ncbi:oligosaccharide flippase family protein [Alteromonas sp. D210916BOD_24]|uniref:oligosaccharide flippase family protein n=1 Tax=Alteromonas sp. D210916BOD_24 TaxID=3157618 RepID=UPI00399D44A3